MVIVMTTIFTQKLIMILVRFVIQGVRVTAFYGKKKNTAFRCIVLQIAMNENIVSA